ncbi:MAG: SSI family serine proteinase inhibitor [Propionibacteriaceae bacterium]
MRNLGRGGAAALLVLITVGCGPTTPDPTAPSAPGPTVAPTSAGPSTPASSPSASAPTPSPSASRPSKHPGPGPSDPSVRPAEKSARLRIVYRADGTSTQVWTLTCAPNGGNHPDPAAACAALAKAGVEPFTPVSSDQVCSQQHGGPQTATISGTAMGQQISGAFSRKNGCEIARWTRLQGLLPAV